MKHWLAILGILAATVTFPSTAAHAAILAADDFSSYTPGSLLGQKAGGIGFSGNWGGSIATSMVVYSDQTVGNQGSNRSSSAGNNLNFATPININGGQLFIKMTYTNTDTTPFEASRLDLNLGSKIGVMFGGTYNALDLVVRSPLHTGSGDLVASSGITTPGTYNLVAVLDAKNRQFGLWVDPDANDFYNALTGNNSANAMRAWSIPAGGLPSFSGYSLIRNIDDKVKFDNVVFATTAQDVGIKAVPAPNLLPGMVLLGLGYWRKRHHVKS